MRKLFAIVAALLLLATSHGAIASASGKVVISIDLLREMFADMRTKAGYREWNVDGPLLWGYFFTDKDEKKLSRVAAYLKDKGYNFVSVFPADDKGKLFLHVEKVEHHTPESLNQRNREFYELADQFQLDSYDGMDVGPAK
jgi:cold shock CspA family protein